MADQKAYAVGEGREQLAVEQTSTTAQSEPSLAQLVSNLISDAQTLVRREIDLARTEIVGEIGKARRGAIMLGAGIGMAAIGGLFLLVALAEALIAFDLLARWLSYLVIGAILATIGVIALVVGIQRFQHVDPVPHETIDSLRKDVSWLSEQTPSDRK